MHVPYLNNDGMPHYFVTVVNMTLCYADHAIIKFLNIKNYFNSTQVYSKRGSQEPKRGKLLL